MKIKGEGGPVSPEENVFENPIVAKEWIKNIEVELGEPSGFRHEIYRDLEEVISGLKPGSHILDVGSGEGSTSAYVKNAITNGNRYFGVEPSKILVDYANSKYKKDGVNFGIGNAYDTGLEAENADLLIMVMVWFHLKDIQKVANEIARNLKPDSDFYIVTPNPNVFDWWIKGYEDYKIDGKTLRGKVNTPGHPMSDSIFYMHTDEDTKNALKNSGLEITSIKYLGSLPGAEQGIFEIIRGKKI